MTTPARLTFAEKLAYGLGDTASNFFFQAFNIFLAYYYTDVVGIKNTAAVGWLLGSMPIVVAALNPVIGMLADRTTSRWGKFRPWILWGALPYGILGYVMFANPGFSPDGQLVFAYATYTLMLVAYAAINTPYSALMGVMSASSEDRTSLSTYRFACAFTGALLIGSLVPKLSKFFARIGGSEAAGFRYTMAIFAVISVAMFLFTFFRTRERVAPPATQKPSLGADVRDLFRNRPWLVLFFAAFLTLANTGLRSGSGVYYFKYVIGDFEGLSAFNFWGFLAFIVGSLTTKIFMRFASRRKLMIGLTILNALAMASFYVLDPHNRPLLYVMNIFASFVAGPTPAIVWSMYADTADYGEWRFGRRTTGLVFSATVFVQKVGLAIGGAMIVWLLGRYGYVADAVQTPRALHGIMLLFSVLPGALALLSGFAIFFYPLEEKDVKQIEKDLAARQSATPAPTAA
ncbi:MAG TPA: MFS transporter [Opitutaceae bacterium]|nr:MFS transporter [Opitutaceae bacterium]